MKNLRSIVAAAFWFENYTISSSPIKTSISPFIRPVVGNANTAYLYLPNEIN